VLVLVELFFANCGLYLQIMCVELHYYNSCSICRF